MYSIKLTFVGFNQILCTLLRSSLVKVDCNYCNQIWKSICKEIWKGILSWSGLKINWTVIDVQTHTRNCIDFIKNTRYPISEILQIFFGKHIMLDFPTLSIAMLMRMQTRDIQLVKFCKYYCGKQCFAWFSYFIHRNAYADKS